MKTVSSGAEEEEEEGGTADAAVAEDVEPRTVRKAENSFVLPITSTSVGKRRGRATWIADVGVTATRTVAEEEAGEEANSAAEAGDPAWRGAKFTTLSPWLAEEKEEAVSGDTFFAMVEVVAARFFLAAAAVVEDADVEASSAEAAAAAAAE